MNSKKYNILLAGLMCLGLGACSTSPDRINASTINSGELYGETAGGVGLVTAPAIAGSSAGSSGSSGMESSSMRSGTAGATGSYGTSPSGGAAMSSGASSGGSSSADVQSPGMTSYGVIHSIDAVPRTQAFGSAATMGGSVGGQSGGSGAMTGGSSDMVYRVILRMDDGSTRAVIQETRPSFQTGDRVRMASNLLQRY
jgi:hypothetical protein